MKKIIFDNEWALVEETDSNGVSNKKRVALSCVFMEEYQRNADALIEEIINKAEKYYEENI